MKSVSKWIFCMIGITLLDFILIFVGIFSYHTRKQYMKAFYPELLDKEEKE